jgi:predicted DNA-binding transcriptional regulator YafY
MQSAAKIKRYFRIIDFIENHPKPTPTELCERLKSEGFELSRRTLERAINDLRDEFFINIQFVRKQGMYVILDDEDGYTQQLIGFFKLSYQAETLTSSLGVQKKMHKHISYDFDQIVKGTKFISPILQAISERKKIEIEHKGFKAEESNKRILEPYLLKEYRGRWYLLGKVENDSFLSFGFDRIINIEKLDKSFNPTLNDPKTVYQDVIGLSGWNLDKVKIKLEFTPLQGRYIKSLPIHNSQIILSETSEKMIVELDLKPNFEFFQIIWGYGSSCKIVSPKSVIASLKEELRKTLVQYE